MPNPVLIALIPLLPLASFIILGLWGKQHLKKISGWLATIFLTATTLLSFYTGYLYFFEAGKSAGIYQTIIPFSYTWLSFSEGVSIDMGAILDPISVMMLIVVSFVSLMVHIYSLAYMKGEERFPVYFSFLGLFTFSMLGLVISSNIFQLYIFWELVGLSSFLLIGFYYEKPSAVAACKKAFIVTRFADLGMLIGILILSFYAGTLDFTTLIERLTQPGSENLSTALAASFLGVSALTWAMVLVFIGGAGKSAMFPLHIWLPDAMEGPTPVSALIHAATMVVAGVFLVARLFPVFSFSSPEALNVVAIVGIVSAFLAAIIACTQTDIKRVLAFSTMSQIGFMMMALGVSGYGGHEGLGYSASMFHLFTHAMFKALLFLCAGAVIHFIHRNDINEMGGLNKRMPGTHFMFLIACLAISGIPPFAGFFSKEEILQAAFDHNQIIYWIALLTSGITAFYMFRLYFSVFWNQPSRLDDEKKPHREFLMILPMVLLTLGSVFAGFIPFGSYVTSDGAPLVHSFDLRFAILPVSIAVAGILIAALLYKVKNNRAENLSNSLGVFYTAAFKKFYVDEVYQFVTKKILFGLIAKPAAWFDKNIVDGMVNLTGSTTQLVSEKIKGVQSGKIQQYAIYFLLGTIVLASIFIYWWK